MPPSFDPVGILARKAEAGNVTILDENRLELFEMDGEGETIEGNPDNFRPGDVVEAQVTLIAIKNRADKYHMKIIARALLLVENVHRKVLSTDTLILNRTDGLDKNANRHQSMKDQMRKRRRESTPDLLPARIGYTKRAKAFAVSEPHGYMDGLHPPGEGTSDVQMSVAGGAMESLYLMKLAAKKGGDEDTDREAEDKTLLTPISLTGMEKLTVSG